MERDRLNNRMDNHILTTHFNLQGIKEYPNAYQDIDWLNYRLNLFTNYTLPSLNNQTDLDFHLIMFCNTNTPEVFKSKLLQLEEENNYLHLIWDQTHFTGLGGDIPTFYKNIKETYLKNRKNNSEEVICSKIGTDDLVEARYNQVIKQIAENNPIASISTGLYWDINTNKFIYSVFPTGPFVMVKSKLSDFKGELREYSHHELISKAKGASIQTDEPLWIQLIHGDNVWNSLEKMPGNLIDNPDDNYLKINFGYNKL